MTLPRARRAAAAGRVCELARAEKGVDRRKAKYQIGKRRVVVTFRERLGRTRSFITLSEVEGVELAKRHVDRLAIMHADEGSHWDMLHAGWETERVNHSVNYSDHGKHTNWVERYFSRLPRMVSGQHHHVSPQYLYQYANHAAWCEDNHRNSNRENAADILGKAMANGVSRVWKGYWPRASA